VSNASLKRNLAASALWTSSPYYEAFSEPVRMGKWINSAHTILPAGLIEPPSSADELTSFLILFTVVYIRLILRRQDL